MPFKLKQQKIFGEKEEVIHELLVFAILILYFKN